MRNLIANIIILSLAIISSCSQPQKKAATDDKSQKEEPNTETINSDVDLKELSQKRIKESIFFYLRDNFINPDDNDFFQSENLSIDGTTFHYTAKIYDRELLALSHIKGKRIVTASMFQYGSQDEDDLSTEITVQGSYILKANGSDLANETKSQSIILDINGDYETSYISQSPYGYNDNQRVGDGYPFEEELVVMLNEPIIYTKETFYLKARIHELSVSDLEGFNSDELAYLRNELFARHGHTFKTDKMIQYFNDKTWYQPVYDDATNFLNETEKKNALFIKSLES